MTSPVSAAARHLAGLAPVGGDHDEHRAVCGTQRAARGRDRRRAIHVEAEIGDDPDHPLLAAAQGDVQRDGIRALAHDTPLADKHLVGALDRVTEQFGDERRTGLRPTELEQCRQDVDPLLARLGERLIESWDRHRSHFRRLDGGRTLHAPAREHPGHG